MPIIGRRTGAKSFIALSFQMKLGLEIAMIMPCWVKVSIGAGKQLLAASIRAILI